MTRDNVAPWGPDDQLTLSLEKIDAPEEIRLPGEAGLLQYKVDRRDSRVNVDIDVHGHADFGLMKFDDFTFSMEGVETLFPPPHDPSKDGISAVRLLGCDVANHKAGRNAMAYLKTKLNVPVYGTQTGLDADDFQSDGLIPGRGDLIESAATTALPLPTAGQVVTAWSQKFPNDPRWNTPSHRVNVAKRLPTTRQLSPRAIHLGVSTLNRIARILQTILQSPWAISTLGLRAAYRTAYIPHHLWLGTGGPRFEFVRVDILMRGHAIRLFPLDIAPRTLVMPTSSSTAVLLKALVDLP